MRIACTGLATTYGTKLLTGINSKYTLELRPGDWIAIGLYTGVIQSIFDDSNILLVNNIPTVSNQVLYITKANPIFLTPFTSIDYTSISSVTGEWHSSTNILHGGQAKMFYYDRYMSTLQTSKAVNLPSGFEYTTPYTHLSLLNTTAGSTSLTTTTLTTKVSTTLNSNIITYISGNTNVLFPEAYIKIDGVEYTITSVVKESNMGTVSFGTHIITLNKPVHATFTAIYLELNTNYAIMYPSGTHVLINGKLYMVVTSGEGYITIAYPISDSDNVIIRKPLMGTKYGKNNIRLFNTTYSTEFLSPGNLIIVQDIRSEDELYQVNTCYTEINYIARYLSSDIVLTNELNNYTYTGIVCLGRPNLGLEKPHPYAICTPNGFNTNAVYYIPAGLQVNDYIKIDESIHKVTNITRGTYNTYVEVDGSIASGQHVVSLPSDIEYTKTYTTLISNLMLKLAAKIITTQYKRTASVVDLLAEFLYTNYFAYTAFAKPPIISSVYTPVYFAVNRLALPPHDYTQYTALIEATSSISTALQYQIFKRYGLPITSDMG